MKLTLEQLAQEPCPRCHQRELHIELRMVNKTVTGTKVRIVAREWPYLVCGACGINAPADE